MIKMSRLLLGFLLVLVTGSLMGCLGAANYIEDSYEYQGTTREETVEYDDAGECTKMTEFTGAGEIKYYIEYKLDENGEPVEYRYDADGKLESMN